MSQIRVGIIGITGSAGEMFEKFFQGLNCMVSGCSRRTEETIQDIVQKSDVVLFCVPISASEEVIAEALLHAREEQLFIDTSGLKSRQAKILFDSVVESALLHIMVAPDITSLEGLNIIFCPGHLDKWRSQLDSWLAQTGANICEMSPEEHDQVVSILQGWAQPLSFVLAMAVRDLGVDMQKVLKLSSPHLIVANNAMSRVMSLSAAMWADMWCDNPHTIEAFDALTRSFLCLRNMIIDGDKEKIIAEAQLCTDHLGEENIAHGAEQFVQIIKFLAQQSKKSANQRPLT